MEFAQFLKEFKRYERLLTRIETDISFGDVDSAECKCTLAQLRHERLLSMLKAIDTGGDTITILPDRLVRIRLRIERVLEHRKRASESFSLDHPAEKNLVECTGSKRLENGERAPCGEKTRLTDAFVRHHFELKDGYTEQDVLSRVVCRDCATKIRDAAKRRGKKGGLPRAKALLDKVGQSGSRKVEHLAKARS